jgi:hypothetical protein
MIIRYIGGNDGICSYLETGRKEKNPFLREEMDKRIFIDGDLSLTNAIIESIPNHGQQRYLNIMMSFHEQNITRERMRDVFQQYKNILMTAYKPDEYNIYAEIHWPKIKQFYNSERKRIEKRFPHIHIVIPTKNLLTGGFLNPCARYNVDLKSFEAIQEKLNRDNDLFSSRKVAKLKIENILYLEQYKNQVFSTKNKFLKEKIIKALMLKNIRTLNAFQILLSDFGQVRIRNIGKNNEYFALRLDGEKKFINLKEAIFRKDFIEERKLSFVNLTDTTLQKRIDDWYCFKSKEIKFLYNGKKDQRSLYVSSDLALKKALLEDLERSYERSYRPLKEVIPEFVEKRLIFDKKRYFEFEKKLKSDRKIFIDTRVLDKIDQSLDTEHFLGFLQLKFAVDLRDCPLDQKPSLVLRKYIGLDLVESFDILLNLYEKQENGNIFKLKSESEYSALWIDFYEKIYSKNLLLYQSFKDKGKKEYCFYKQCIQNEFVLKQKLIRNMILTFKEKHYLRSLNLFEKLQKMEALKKSFDQQNHCLSRLKYPYSNLFYNFAVKNEDMKMKVLDDLKRRYFFVDKATNTLGTLNPHQQMFSGSEAIKRAKLMQVQQKELDVKIRDLQPKLLKEGSVTFLHKETGRQFFVSHFDHIEMNRVPRRDEVVLGLIYALERFGSPLEVKGTSSFRKQVVDVVFEEKLNINFTDESMNKLLQEKNEKNEITVQSLELDKTLLPKKALDKALLESKKRELDSLNEKTGALQKEINESLVSDLIERHKEFKSKEIEDQRVQEIAKLDIDAWSYLEGYQEQKLLSLSISSVMDNLVYKSYLEKHGSNELQLTIDASQLRESKDLDFNVS